MKMNEIPEKFLEMMKYAEELLKRTGVLRWLSS